MKISRKYTLIKFIGAILFIAVLLTLYLWEKGYIKPYSATQQSEKTEQKTYVDDTYKFSFNLPSYYDIQVKHDPNQAFTNAVWSTYENLSFMTIGTVTNISWEASDDLNSARSVRDLRLRYYKNPDHKPWEDFIVENKGVEIDSRVDFSDGASLVIAKEIIYNQASDFSRNTFLVLPVKDAILAISTHHYKPNQPEVNSLLIGIYNTFESE